MDPTWLLGLAALAGAAWAAASLLPSLLRPVMPPCPLCLRGDEVVEVVYGEPDRKMLQKAKRRQISLGGIKIQEDAPDLHCLRCNYSWKTPTE